MNESEIQAVVIRALGRIAPETPGTSIRPDANLRDQLDIDSMDFMHLLAALEEELGVRIEQSAHAGLASVNDLVAYLSSALERDATGSAPP